LADANRKIETTIREIKENKADKEITKLIRTELEEYKEDLFKEETVTKNIISEKEENPEFLTNHSRRRLCKSKR